MRGRGWSDSDLAVVRAAYRLATQLFSAAYRPSGNTFLAHLVRTASIAAEHGARPPVVVAGLLHAAYSHGEWGTSAYGMSAAKRARLRREVDEEVEALVAAYSALERRRESISHFAAHPARPSRRRARCCCCASPTNSRSTSTSRASTR
jgi:(p)ppGpp synthase/HD superfamily hydrolase